MEGALLVTIGGPVSRRPWFYVVDENPDAFNLSPEDLGGTNVRISLFVVDPDGATAQAIGAGATEVFPVDDHPYGLRQGRVFGHHWLIRKPPDLGGAPAASTATAALHLKLNEVVRVGPSTRDQ